MDPLTKFTRAKAYSGGRVWIIPVVLLITVGVIGGSAALGMSLKVPKRTAQKVLDFLSVIKPTPKLEAPFFQISEVVGSAHKIQQANETDLLAGDLLGAGDQILTDGGGFVMVETKIGGNIRIDENSKIIFPQHSLNEVRLEVNTGKIFITPKPGELIPWIVTANGVIASASNATWSMENKQSVNVMVFANPVKIIPNNQAGVIVETNQRWNGSENRVYAIELSDIANDNFMIQSLENGNEEIALILTPTPVPAVIVITPTPGEVPSIDSIQPTKAPVFTDINGPIILTGQKMAFKAVLDWMANIYSDGGYITLWSKTSKPTYPPRKDDSFHIFTDEIIRHDEILKLEPGSTYYFRVCSNLGDSCGLYSNEISIQY